MVDDKEETIKRAGEKPQELTEEGRYFKDMLITIVEQQLKSYFEHGVWWWAARFALALGDSLSQGLLLREIMQQKDLSKGQYEAPGLLAIKEGISHWQSR